MGSSGLRILRNRVEKKINGKGELKNGRVLSEKPKVKVRGITGNLG
jgi:hypothetical protein